MATIYISVVDTVATYDGISFPGASSYTLGTGNIFSGNPNITQFLWGGAKVIDYEFTSRSGRIDWFSNITGEGLSVLDLRGIEIDYPYSYTEAMILGNIPHPSDPARCNLLLGGCGRPQRGTSAAVDNILSKYPASSIKANNLRFGGWFGTTSSTGPANVTLDCSEMRPNDYTLANGQTFNWASLDFNWTLHGITNFKLICPDSANGTEVFETINNLFSLGSFTNFEVVGNGYFNVEVSGNLASYGYVPYTSSDGNAFVKSNISFLAEGITYKINQKHQAYNKVRQSDYYVGGSKLKTDSSKPTLHIKFTNEIAGVIHKAYMETLQGGGQRLYLQLYNSTDKSLKANVKWYKSSNMTTPIAEGNSISTYLDVNDTDAYTVVITTELTNNPTLTASVNPALSGTVEGTGTYKKGTSVTIKAKPKQNYKFKNWTKSDGSVVSTEANYTFVLNESTYLIANMEQTGSVIPVNPSQPGGGGGTGVPGSDGISESDQYNPGANLGGEAGLYTIWCPTNQQLINLSNTLYNQTLAGTIKNFVDQFGSFGGNITDYMFKAFHLPVGIPASQRNTSTFQLGWYSTTSQSDYATSWGVMIDLGSVDIPQYYGNALDYRMQIQLYLPYIGYVPVDAVSVVGKTLSIKYMISFVTGECVAHVYVNGVEHYQFLGSMAQDMPISNDSSLANGLTSIATKSANMALVAGLGAEKKY